MKARKEAVDSINHAMARFPMILEVLDVVRKVEVPCPGDVDIERGCERTLTAMLVELAKIRPAPAGKPDLRDETALGWVRSAHAVRLVQADHLERFQQFIERLIVVNQAVRSRMAIPGTQEPCGFGTFSDNPPATSHHEFTNLLRMLEISKAGPSRMPKWSFDNASRRAQTSVPLCRLDSCPGASAPILPARRRMAYHDNRHHFSV